MAPRPDSGSAGCERPVLSSRRWAFGALTENAVDASGPVDVDGFQELRRQGLFDDDGRNPPPSWWAR
jgi:hypothetical protein